MDKLTRDILERIARECRLPPGDPRVLQMAYRVVWEIGTGQSADEVPRDPNPLLPATDDPALRSPDHQDLTDLVDSILDDPIPKTEHLARPQIGDRGSKSTGMWLKETLEGLKSEPADSPRREEAMAWVPAPPPQRGEPDLAELARSVEDLPAEPVSAAVAPVPPEPASVAALPPRRGPKFASRRPGVRPTESMGETMTPEQAAKNAPAWLISAALHMVAAVILMNIVYFTTYARPADIFRISLQRPERTVAPPDKLPEPEGGQEHGIRGEHDDDSGPSGPVDPLDPQPTGVKLPEINDEPIAPNIALGSGPFAPGLGVSGENGFGGMYAGRGGRGKIERLQKNGGGEDTESAVLAGLLWLQAHQAKNGSWGRVAASRLCRTEPPCSGMVVECHLASSGLALLAFLGAGYTHRDGPQSTFALTVRRATEYISSCQLQSGLFDDPDPRHLYTHAICTFALAELYGLTQDQALREPVLRGLAYLSTAQQDNGGWDYNGLRSGRGDASITSWCVMALRAARAAGLPVSSATWRGAQRFYNVATDSNAAAVCYSVQSGLRSGGSLALTASGILGRNYLGIGGGPVEKLLLEKVEECPPAPGKTPTGSESPYQYTLYYIYYGTLVMFHEGGEAWSVWNATMKKELLGSQCRDGHAKGSWNPVGCDSGPGLRIYTTAMAVLNLEVYYRYLGSYKTETDALSPLDTGDRKPLIAPSDSIDTLRTLLRGDEMLSRRAAFRELCRRKHAESIPALIEAARRESTSARPLMIEDLSAFGEDAAVLEAFVEFLKDADAMTREAAMRGLKRATGLLYESPEDWKNWWDGRTK